MKRGAVFWIVLDFVLAAIVAISGNIVASLLQESLGLTDPGRAAFVFVLFVAALGLSLLVTLKRFAAEASDNVGLEALLSRLVPDSIERERASRNRQAMLQLVKNTWIKGVLEPSLNGAAMIELGMEERADAVERPWYNVVQMPGQSKRQLPRGTRIIDVFDQMNRSLLLLGEPGSGKTTVLLELARETIERAEQDFTQPIPVVFNLSSWVTGQPIDEWLVDELVGKYYVARKIARSWIEKDELLILLDGLDEVRLNLRKNRRTRLLMYARATTRIVSRVNARSACVEALNDFRLNHAMPIVVCSRLDEYQTIAGKLKLSGAVFLQPLTWKMMDTYLGNAGPEFLPIQSVLRQDALLRELAQTPLMLSVLILTHRAMPLGNFSVLNIVDVARDRVLAGYVQAMFQRRGMTNSFASEQTKHWLVWLAQRMSKHAQNIFLIEAMQPDWLPPIGRGRVRILASLIVVLVAVLGIGPVFGPGYGLLWGLLLVLIGVSDRIDPVEKVEWSWRRMRSNFFPLLLMMLVIGLLGKPAINSLGEQQVEWLGELTNEVFGGLVNTPFIQLLDRLFRGQGEKIFAGLVFFLVVGSVLWLVTGLSYGTVTHKTIPNQGIWFSARNGLLVGLVTGLITGLILGSVGVLFSGPVDEIIEQMGNAGGGGLWVGLSLGLLLGGISVIQHIALRCILWRKGYVPLRYARFLDYAVECTFLRQVGGGYIFVHRLLQEYFASLWTEETKP